MRSILFIVFTVVLTVFLGACVNSGPAPQNVKLQSPDGKAVIIKDIYELPLIENKKLKETEIVKVFFPKTDNIRMKCSMTLVKIPSGVSPPQYKQSSAQVIYAISGGGKLVIDGNMIILKKGIMVYVPPNAAMLIINNVNKILELIVITSPPFETSQMTVLGKTPTKVKIAKDSEDDMDDNDIQKVSEKYKTQKKSARSLSIEEYRKKINTHTLPDTEGKDVIADLLNETRTTTTGKNNDWPLKMPDSSKIPLNKLEQEQREKLIPSTPQKAEITSLNLVQDLTPQEQKVPIRGEKNNSSKIKKTSKNNQDSLEKLLDDQKKQQKELFPTKTSKKSMASPKNKNSKSDQDLLNELLNDSNNKQKKDIPENTLKVKRTSLKHVQELSPEEKAIPTKSDNKL